MPIRITRPRKNDGLKKYIAMLYEKPTLKFLKASEPWEPIADLIFGPLGLHTDKFFNEDVRQQGFKRLATLRELWFELRDDILEAQKQYQPNNKPWGARFDKKKRSHDDDYR
jgi:hypothetical protein